MTSACVVRLSPEQLDELMLVRDGFCAVDEVDLPELSDGDQVVDLEGAVVARWVDGGLTFAQEDGRPFASLYGFARWSSSQTAPTTEHDPDHVLWIDNPSDHIAELAPPNATLLVPTSPSHLLGHRAAASLRSALAASEQRADLTVAAVPVDASDERRVLIEHRLGATSSAKVSDHESASPTGVFVLLTGLSGSGKSTIARALREALVRRGDSVTLLDGDQVRRELSSGLGFSPADRDTNVRRIGWVGAEIAAHGGAVVACPIAPYDSTRRAVREMVERAGAQMVLVHVATPLAECERRDRKGLYAKARAGQIPDFTGISAPYEAPTDAELVIDTARVPVDEAVARIIDVITA